MQKQLLKWRESGDLLKITGQSSPQIVLSFVASFSACFAYIYRHLVAKVETTKNLPRLQRVISINFSDWPFLHAELA